MKLKEFIEIIEGKLLTKENILDKEISGGYVSDLLSDVMGSAQEGQVWITIMRHLNVIAVASLTNIPAITFSKGYLPDAAVIAKADQEGITLISSNLDTFDIAGILYKHFSL